MSGFEFPADHPELIVAGEPHAAQIKTNVVLDLGDCR